MENRRVALVGRRDDMVDIIDTYSALIEHDPLLEVVYTAFFDDMRSVMERDQRHIKDYVGEMYQTNPDVLNVTHFWDRAQTSSAPNITETYIVAVRSAYPDLPVLLTSGGLGSDFARTMDITFLQRPHTTDAYLDMLKKVGRKND